MQTWLIVLIVVVALIAVLGIVLAVRASKRSSAPQPAPTPIPDTTAGQAQPDTEEQGRPNAPPVGRETSAELEAGDAAAAEAEAGEETGADAEIGDAAVVEPSIEVPEASSSRWQRLRKRLAGSGSPLGAALLKVLSRDSLSEDDWDELEETLLLADVGAEATDEILRDLRTELRIAGSGADARSALRGELIKAVTVEDSRDLNLPAALDEAGKPNPAVVLVVGVNGAGKTTAIGRIARLLVAEGKTVLLGAADTFRAAAADQLETWGARVGVDVVRGPEAGDPASVAFDAVKQGKGRGVDVVIIDTAGRLQNKANLMDELGKIARVAAKQAPITETLLVLDATTGQNGLSQGSVFAEATDVSGIVLTKLDGSAKGGIVISVQRRLGVPVKLVGLGEGPDDLAPFVPEDFVDGILG